LNIHFGAFEVLVSNIHYFPRYSQQENFVTNNTLLLLVRLHQFNRFKFEKFMDAICADLEIQLAGSWLQFKQQQTTGKSVVDGFISQESVKIAVETKLTQFFDSNQLERHLSLFGAEQNKLLILLSPSVNYAFLSQLAAIRAIATPRNIQVIYTSFEDIIDKTRGCLSEYDEEMHALVNDYESFCSDMELLPKDQYTIFAPPCRLSLSENCRYRLYYCPDDRSIRRARYLGVYANKSIRAVGLISKIATVEIKDGQVASIDPTIVLTNEEKERILGASKEAQERGWDLSTGNRFYLCDEFEETDFRKTTPGGIQGTRYIDIRSTLGTKTNGALSTSALATALRDHTWK
jgi:hypothetical protein